MVYASEPKIRIENIRLCISRCLVCSGKRCLFPVLSSFGVVEVLLPYEASL